MKAHTLNKLKKEILGQLKREALSITRLSFIIGRNHYVTLEVLDSLEEEGSVKKTAIGKFTIYEVAGK